MKKIIFSFILFFLFLNFSYANHFIDREFEGHRIKIIKYDLKDYRYKFKIGVNLDYHASSLRDLMLKFNGISAINGVFLCPADYSECGGKNFTKNERYFKGVKIGDEDSTGKRVVFALDKNNKAFLFQTDKINYRFEKSIYYGFSNFPLLLKSGETKVGDYKLDYKMKSKGKRNFICRDKGNNYIYSGYVYNISLKDLGELLKKLGCYDALNLDAGATSSMIYNGRQIIGPGRDLLDGIVIERVGLDTKLILESLKKHISKFEKRLNGKYLEEKIKITDKVVKAIRDFRKNFYEKNSTDLFDEKGKNIGYEININSLKKLMTIFIINSIDYEISKLNRKYKKEYKETKKIEDLLF